MAKTLLLLPTAKQGETKRVPSKLSVPSSPPAGPTIQVKLRPVHKNSPRTLIGEWRFDRIGLHFTTPYDSLSARLPATLVNISSHDHSRYAHEAKLMQATQYEYRAQLRLVEPSVEYWQELLPYEVLLGNYKVSYMELAFDIPCQSIEEAQGISAYFQKHLRKRYHHRLDMKIYMGTAYWEPRKSSVNLVVYPRRFGKRDGHPQAHVEFRVRGAARIQSKLGISTLRDLSTFDPLTFFRKHLILEKIDYERLGFWLPDSRSPTPDDEDERLQRRRARQKGLRYCRRQNLNSAAALRAHLLKQRRTLQKTTRRLKPSEVQFKYLKAHMLNTFFIPLVVRMRQQQ